MSKLSELMVAVKEANLTKSQLEDYYRELTDLEVNMHMTMADLEKKEAQYLEASEEKTGIASQRKWNVTPDGLREIEVKRYLKITEKLLSSVKHRIFNAY